MTINRGYGPELNPGTFTSNLTLTGGLDAALFGTVDTSVLLFAGAATDEGIPLVSVSTAENGTTFYLTRPGIYSVQFRASNTGAAAVTCGVNLGYLGAPGTGPLAGVPAIGDGTTQDAVTVQGQDAAANAAAVALSSMVTATQAEILKGQANLLPGIPLRITASGGALDPANATLQIRRVASSF